MRPIRKGNSPIIGNFAKYEDAKEDFVGRLGLYCSYCERYIPTSLAIEHIEPKDGPYGQPHLATTWTNFLLACTNCNSCKGRKQVNLNNLLFPDRDNTFDAYIYEDDGTISCSSHLSLTQQAMAENTLRLVGLDKLAANTCDSNGEFVALDRVRQRMEVIATAQSCLNAFADNPTDLIKNLIEKNALKIGFFSIWMKVFDAYPEMKLRFINVFKGTANSGCFDLITGDCVTPAPNSDMLLGGGKV